MVKKSKDIKFSRKRSAQPDVDSEPPEDDKSLINASIEDESSESEQEDVHEKNTNEIDSGGEDEEDDEEEAELNRLLAEEEAEEEDDASSDFSDDSAAMTDKLSGVRLDTIADTNIYTKYADGAPRIIKPEIEPEYDSDDSDVETHNTIGNIPLAAYDEMPHIGYDINGKRIMRPAKGSALDKLLEQIELPEGWTGLLDKESGASLNLTGDELELISKLQKNESTDDNINPYEPLVDWFTRHEEVMPLSAAPEPKRRFVPSKHEAKRIMKIVRAIREGRIIPPEKLKELKEKEAAEEHRYDIWGNSEETVDHIMNLRAPKLPPPTNEESYNPPEEYLLTEEEKEQWEKSDPSEREKNFIPHKYGALRKVPGYTESVRERFERSLDLYLAPRIRRNKLNIDPESLIPKLPSPKDLRPFPIRCSTTYVGHQGRIRTLSIDPSGLWLATGSDDGSVMIWEILTGRAVYRVQLIDAAERNQDHIECLEWNPDKETGILAVAAGETIFLIVPPIFGFDVENNGKSKIEKGFGFDKFGSQKKSNVDVNESDGNENSEVTTGAKKVVAEWHKPSKDQQEKDISITITCKKTVKKISWHRKGDYLVSVQPESGNTAILVHQVSKHLSQSPFRKSKGITMDAKFHPSKPQLFVCSQRYIRIYDLSQQILVKKLLPGARWLSGFDIHPRGDNLVASSFDKRVLWHDLDLASTPYKTLRYHDKAVRTVAFHKRLPLFCSAADDGNLHVFHATVYDDLMRNPLIVPLKQLVGHKIVNNLGILDSVWHPREPWLFSAGADSTARLWTP